MNFTKCETSSLTSFSLKEYVGDLRSELSSSNGPCVVWSSRLWNSKLEHRLCVRSPAWKCRTERASRFSRHFIAAMSRTRYTTGLVSAYSLRWPCTLVVGLPRPHSIVHLDLLS